MIKNARKIPPSLDEDQLEAFFKAIEDFPSRGPIRKALKKRDLCLFRMMYLLGLRESEALAIRDEDIDLDKRQILIKRLKKIKSDPNYYYTIPQKLVPFIKAWQKARKGLRGANRSRFLFISQESKGDEGRMTTDHLYNRFKLYARAAFGKETRFRPHSLRHACGRRMAAQGANVFDIAQRLGHTTLPMAQWYSRLYGKDRIRRDEAINDMLEI